MFKIKLQYLRFMSAETKGEHCWEMDFLSFHGLFFIICRSGADVEHTSQNNLLRATAQSFWTLNWFKPEICK